MLLSAQCTPQRLLFNKGQLEAEHEAEVTISSQHAGWSLPSPPCNSPWLEGTLPELDTAFPSSGVFPNSPLMLGFHLAASQQFFLSSPSWALFSHPARSNKVSSRRSRTSLVWEFKTLLCRASQPH